MNKLQRLILSLKSWLLSRTTTPEQRYEAGVNAAKKMIGDGTSWHEINELWCAACDDEKLSWEGPEYAQGFKSVLRPLWRRGRV